MAALKLHKLDGTTSTQELSRSQPLTIGRQPFNDICIPDDDVAPMHCRISFQKTGFEVMAATSSGVELNSSTVAHALLKPGDTLRIGSLDLIFEDESDATMNELILPRKNVESAKKLDREVERHESRKSRSKHESTDKRVEDLSLFDGLVETESQAMLNMLDDEHIEHEEEPSFASTPVLKPLKPVGNSKPVGFSGNKKVRPGEQEILKSPLVLGLTGGGVALTLITLILWFLLGREQANKLYERGVQEMNAGQYMQSAVTLERFIYQYPGHGMRKNAERNLEKVSVLKEISGASPAWNRGLERLNELIKAHRNDKDFGELHAAIYEYAEQISMGAAKTAESARDGEMLITSTEAQTLLERYADPSAPPTATIGRIKEQRAKADRAIAKQTAFDQAMKRVDAALAERKPMQALSERERLVKRFPEFAGTKRIRDALQKSLDLERTVVALDETERAAETKDDPAPSNAPILGMLHARSRTEDNSQGRIVFVMAKDSCYAIDPASGELVWRRVVGAHSPFFPVLIAGARSAVLLFDTRSSSLIACDINTGRLIWKQPLNARALAKPLIHEGQIYLSLDGNQLVRVDVDTGRLSATIRFSQNLATSPVVSRNGNYLLVPGEMSMIYALSLHVPNQPQLSAVATTFTDHAAGSISAPALSMGQLLLLCENDQAESARLRLWDAGDPSKSLVELEPARVAGQVHDVPILRGNQLVVPVAGEQFYAFAVTDEGKGMIALIGQYRADQNPDRKQAVASLFVTLGSDNQFWSAGSAFRRFEIASNSIRMDSNSAAPGIASQPLQGLGDQFFVGRKSQYSDAVTFSAVDREKLVSPWRCILGDKPIAMIPSHDGGLVWIGESGSLYSLGKSRLADGGFDLKAGADLDLPADVNRPIIATEIDDQRLVVAVAGATVQLYVINSLGQVASKNKLPEFPETAPISLDDGLVVALPSRLKMISSGTTSVQDFPAPVGEKHDKHWLHLVRIGGRELVALDDSGQLTRVQFRDGDIPHLAKVVDAQLDHPVDLCPVLRGDFLYLADSEGTVRQLNAHSFDTDGQTSLAAPIKNIWATKASTLVVSGDHKLRSLIDGKELPERWTIDLGNLEPVGSIVEKEGALWIGCRNGTVVVLNIETGIELRRIELEQSLSLGIRQADATLIAIAVDGTIYRLE